jgi:hypothetical protein
MTILQKHFIDAAHKPPGKLRGTLSKTFALAPRPQIDIFKPVASHSDLVLAASTQRKDYKTISSTQLPGEKVQDA